MTGSVTVLQYPEKLVVGSPGGLPLGISLDNILDRQVPRNRLISEILSLCGLVCRSGQGINQIVDQSILEAKQLPDFAGTEDHFVSITLHGRVVYPELLSLLRQVGYQRMEELSSADLLAFQALYRRKPVQKKLQPRPKHLQRLGLAAQISWNKYALSPNLYRAAGWTLSQA